MTITQFYHDAYTPFGRLPSQRVFTVVGVYDLASEMDSKVVFTHIADNARLLRQKNSKLQQTRLFLKDPFDYQQVEQQISLPTDSRRKAKL